MLRAILVDCIVPKITKSASEFRMDEAESLVSTYGGIVLIQKMQRKQTPDYRTFIGSGKLDELVSDIKEHDINIVLINNELKAQQIYNISEYFRLAGAEVQVWDRIDLILKIFEKHASTKEARLEIELASIKHMGPRIFGMGMELSRQGGGIGTKGIGETNTEIMKRHLKTHEEKIRAQLNESKKTRQLQIEARKRQNFQTVGIVGYTNAGKSSLLNALTKKGAYVADALFATLDTRVGKLYFPEVQKEILLSDTIGFIQDLPHTLIESFHSTLAETLNADLLLHVIDIHDEKMEEKIDVVHDVLEKIGAKKDCIYVFNKMDLGTTQKKLALKKKYPSSCFVSVHNGQGLEELKEQLRKKLFPRAKKVTYG
jgi:GTP-binding protein HflX